jgi:membrane protein DedA with SNARE-associated domain
MSGISGIVEQFPYLGIFMLFILGGIGLPFPEDATLILSGALIANNVVRPLPAFFVVYSGLLLTDFFLFAVGKKYGSKIVTHKRFHKIISPERLLKLEDAFAKWGVLLILVGRHVIVLRSQLMLVSGVMRMSALKFLMADSVSSLFTIALWGGVGYIGGNSLQIVIKDIKRLEHTAIVLVIIFVMLYMFFKYYKMTKGNKS